MIANLSSFVLDTNVLLSALLWPSSVPAQAYRKAITFGNPLLSSAIESEYREVLSRPKFDPYASLPSRLRFIEEFTSRSLMVVVTKSVDVCRHPKDDKFLELALSGNADLILTGDGDLLSLHPWRGIPILSPRDYLAFTV